MDAVVRWENNEDADYIRLMKQYGYEAAEPESDEGDPDSPAPSLRRIRDCVMSLHRHAPFIRKIYIVTSARDPRLGEYLSEFFERFIPIEIVDHKDLFKGYEAVLPTFNPVAVESMLWTIPGLSEQFVYLTCSTILSHDAVAADFFDNEGRAVWRATRHSTFFDTLRGLVGASKRKKEILERTLMLNAATLLGKKYIYIPKEGPLPLLRSVFAAFYESNPEALEENLSYRFPEPIQYDPLELFCLLAEETARLQIR